MIDPGVYISVVLFQGARKVFRVNYYVQRLSSKVLALMNKDALRGGVAPKSHASVRAVCFIPESPCLGDCPVTSFRWSRVRSYGAHGSREICTFIL